MTISREPARKWVRVVCNLSLLAAALVLELLLSMADSIDSLMKIIISCVLIVVFIALPTYIVAKLPNAYNPLAQVLFSILLAGVSIWLGIALNTSSAKREAAAKWLPAAETACKQLLTISNTAERMRMTQRNACSALDPILPSSSRSEPIRQMVEMQCRETAEKLATLRDHVENGVSHWQVFIANNCERGECEAISFRIEEVRQTLIQRLTEDFRGTRCEQNRPQNPSIVQA
jgi:hypothetical protein